MSETIFALATPPGRAAIAVVRISGSQAGAHLKALTRGRRPAPRRASLRLLLDPVFGDPLDEALVLWFPGPQSYTGEDCVELHLHGGRAVVDGVTESLLGLGARLAHPGEFTRRAFDNGKLDLSRAEAVADLVDAETVAQRTQAVNQLDSVLEYRHAMWRSDVIEILAMLDAVVDFPEDDDVTFEDVGASIAVVRAKMTAAAESLRGDRVREGFRVAIMGAPNAGKSSLLNALVRREAAIVTEVPGTTRDVIEAPLTLAGYRVLLADTAGVRDARDAVEAEGIRRARAWAETAALRMWVIDGADEGDAWRDAAQSVQPGDLVIFSKSDLPWAAETARAWAVEQDLRTIALSTARGDGVDDLVEVLTTLVTSALTGAEFPSATRERHRRDLMATCDHLARAGEALAAGASPELAAEDILMAARALERVHGRIDSEDILNQIFSRFCIGK